MRLQKELERTVWAATDKSGYETADGRITNNGSGTTTRYGWRTFEVDLSRYHPLAREPTSPGPSSQ